MDGRLVLSTPATERETARRRRVRIDPDGTRRRGLWLRPDARLAVACPL